MIYTYRWCDGVALNNRNDANVPDSVHNAEIEATDDVDALRQIVTEICGYADQFSTIEDLCDRLDGIEIGAGFRFVFWVRREDGTDVYNASMSEKDYSNIHRLEEWCDMFLRPTTPQD